MVAVALPVDSGCRERRRRRRSEAEEEGALALALAVIICCSPVLIPLSCLCFPLFCLLRLGFRRNPTPEMPEEGGAVAAFLGWPEESGVEEMRLMQRYLEDQLGLVGLGWDQDDANGEDR